ncbi:MAG: hypothetical protein C0476_10870 [Sphingomonas sp.]|nr:hypothetical protein [Sphingomonas sp.]
MIARSPMKVIYEPPLRTIMIAGAGGFAGRALCDWLARDGAFRVVGVDDFGAAPLPREAGNFVAFDRSGDCDALTALMATEQVDTVVAVDPGADALIAATMRYAAVLHPQLRDVLRLVVVGRGGRREPAMTVTHGALYGPGASDDDLIPRTIAAALAGEAIWVDRPGLGVPDWLHIGDYCDAIGAVLLRGLPGGHYHIGARDGRTLLSTVAMICDLVDRVAPRADGRKHRSLIRFGAACAEPHRAIAEVPARLEGELGWRARVSLRDGVIALIDDALVGQRRARPGHHPCACSGPKSSATGAAVAAPAR